MKRPKAVYIYAGRNIRNRYYYFRSGNGAQAEYDMAVENIASADTLYNIGQNAIKYRNIPIRFNDIETRCY